MVRHLLLASALIFCAKSAWADGVFMVVKGDVKVEKDGKQTPAKVGMKVMPADTIIAGHESRAKVVMTDKNVLNISPDSKITIEKYVNNEASGEKNVVLNVLYGKVRSTVNQKYDGEKNQFHVKTPSAVAGVRGTDFISSYQPDSHQANFVTFEGKVEVGKLDGTGHITGSVFVLPGQTSSATGNGGPSQPTTIPKTELAKMDSDSKSDNKNDRLPASDNGGNKGGDKDKKGGANDRGPSSEKKQISFFEPGKAPDLDPNGPGKPEMGGDPCPTCAFSGSHGPTDVSHPPQVDPNYLNQRTKLLINIVYK